MKNLLSKIECALNILFASKYVAFVEKGETYVRYTNGVDEDEIDDIKGLEYEDCD